MSGTPVGLSVVLCSGVMESKRQMSFCRLILSVGNFLNYVRIHTHTHSLHRLVPDWFQTVRGVAAGLSLLQHDITQAVVGV